MIDRQALSRCLTELGLESWQDLVLSLVDQRMQDEAHGDFAKWRHALESLRAASGDDRDSTRKQLMALAPWRKGPFELGDISIDSEWRSDLKWNRLKDDIAPLDGRVVLDVGSGNGYYALNMESAGAKWVIGIDPTLLYVVQFLAVKHLLESSRVFVLPLRLDELPPNPLSFDTTFSMGVLYHQRSPIDHLRQLRGTLRPGGQLVLETLFMPGDESYACTPPDRYARMRNVWLLPTIPELTTWLERSGFRSIRVIDTTVTTTNEQRSTQWMSFESLREALDPDDPSRTVEGWPAPRRIAIVANSP